MRKEPLACEGNVAVFGSLDADSGTERLIVLAETRKRTPDILAQLHVSVNQIATDLCSTPPDDVVLAPPNSVLKTSSGKIRRAASRELYESGHIGKPQRALWIQMVRIVISGFLPQLKQWTRSFFAICYAVYVWLLFGFAAPIIWLLAAILPSETWRWACIRGSLGIIAKCARIPVKATGLENLPPAQSPCLLVANHASYLDGFILAKLLPHCFSFVAKAELKKNFFVRILLQRLGVLFVERFDQQKGVEDARLLLERSHAGRPLLFFAEGTFTRTPGLLPFRLGAFVTAVEGNLPVVPIAIRGTRSILRGDTWFPRHGTVLVHIGKPVQTDPLLTKEKDSWAATMKLRDNVRAWILRHCSEPDLKSEHPSIFNKTSSSDSRNA